MRAVEDALQ